MNREKSPDLLNLSQRGANVRVPRDFRVSHPRENDRVIIPVPPPFIQINFPGTAQTAFAYLPQDAFFNIVIIASPEIFFRNVSRRDRSDFIEIRTVKSLPPDGQKEYNRVWSFFEKNGA